MPRRTQSHQWSKHPELLTSIRSPWDKYRKADWNFERYENAVFARPCDSEDVVYTALDFCVAIVSLRDWTRKFFLHDVRTNGKTLPTGLTDADHFVDYIYERVTWQRAVEAIANTVKHAEYRDAGWPNGIAMPASFFPENLKSEHEACKDGVELFTLLHKHKEVAWWDIALRQHPDNDATTGYIAFGDTLDQWHFVLQDLNYLID